MLEPFPLKVTVLTPQDRSARRGRHATSSAYAKILSIRLPEHAWDAVYKATRIVSERMSEAEFMRQAIESVATALVKHDEAYTKQVEDQQRKLEEVEAAHERTKSKRSVRSTE